LDPKGLGPAARRPTTEQLGFLFERVLPVPIEQVQCAYVRLADGTVAACAAPIEALDAALASEELAAATTLCPAEVPEFIRSAAESAGSPSVGPTRFNLLTGRFLPRSVRRWRRQCRGALAVGGLGVVASLLLGVWLRDRSIGAAIAEVERRRWALIDDAISPLGPDQGLPPDLRLTAELRRLEQTRGSGAAESVTTVATDVSALLAEVLSAWPKATRATVDAVSVTQDSIDLRGTAPDAVGAAAAATAMRSLPGWRVPQPQVRAGREGVTFTVRLEREDVP